MRFLVVCDIHEEEEAVSRIGQKFREGYDNLLMCGDLSRSVSFAEEFLSRFPDAFVIPGNWDSEAVGSAISKAKNYCHGKRIELGDGHNIVGFGYSNITPFGTYGELDEEKIYAQMSKLPIDSKTLLMLHCPPKGFFDEARNHHVGSESILRIIKEKKPMAAFFGHIHEHRGSFDLGPTRLVKIPAALELRAVSAEIVDGKLIPEFLVI